MAKKIEQLSKKILEKDTELEHLRSKISDLEPKVAVLQAQLVTKEQEISLAKREAALEAKLQLQDKIEAAFDRGLSYGHGHGRTPSSARAISGQSSGSRSSVESEILN